ncbi:MAG: hypothetical protein HQK56_20655 [Deltaproteobacteria bacterium]|nr:hypothetical protein [Deltaproteobacteria bacterium]
MFTFLSISQTSSAEISRLSEKAVRIKLAGNGVGAVDADRAHAEVVVMGAISVICIYIVTIMLKGAAAELRDKKERERVAAAFQN